MAKKLVVIGGVAAGATAATRARRVDEHADIVVVERGPYVSFANCGLPYFIAGDIAERSKLILQTPEQFLRRYRIDVMLNTDALSIDRDGRRVQIRREGATSWLPYDALILAQGGSPVMPALPGATAPHVFRLWTVPDMDRLDAYLKAHSPRSAIVVGGGFIGIEMAEAFARRGLQTTVVELQPSVMSVMDPEFGAAISREMASHQVNVMTGVGVVSIDERARTITLTDGRILDAEVVLFSVGVKPELALANDAGLEIGRSGGVVVDQYQRTSDPNIYAAGDMVEVSHKVSGKRVRVPLAGPANRQGRIAGSNAMGRACTYGGALGTSVVKVFDATAAMTGLSERAAREVHDNVGAAVLHVGHHASYYPHPHEITLKLVYDKTTRRILGAQAFGREGVDKRIDVVATALHGKFTLGDLAELDLAYSPPYSSANDPLNLAAFVGENDVSGFDELMTASELSAALTSGERPLVLDVRTAEEFSQGHVSGALHIPVDDLRARLPSCAKDQLVAVYCRSGFRAHLAARILRENGFGRVRNVTGGWLSIEGEGQHLDRAKERRALA